MVLSAVIALAISGCAKRGNVYDRPPSQVRDLLRTVEVPLYMFGGSAATTATVDASDPAAIAWKITADDSSLMTFFASVEPEAGGQSRVIVRVQGARQSKYGDVEARLAKMNEIRAMYLASMTEAVDSTLDGRAYDVTATYPALMAATVANAGHLFASAETDNGPSNSASHR